jgi:hypothetical protein
MPSARLLLLLALVSTTSGCQWLFRSKPAPVAPPTVVEPLAPSPRLLVGRIFSVDVPRRFAFVELAADAPPAAVAEGGELIARTLDLRETSRLRVSRYLRGRTLGTTVEAGQPTAGDEVVWLAP